MLNVSQGRIVNEMGHPIKLSAVCEEVNRLRALNAELAAALLALYEISPPAMTPRRQRIMEQARAALARVREGK